MNSIVGYPDWSQEEAILNAIELWGDSWREYWILNDEEEFQLVGKACAGIAQQILEDSRKLTGELEETGRAIEFITNYGAGPLLHEYLCHLAASRYGVSPSEMADKLLELARIIVEESPSGPVTKYLPRLSRCYVLGLHAETLIMCRAVLENALRSAYISHGIPLPVNEKGGSEMRTRIRAAVMFHLLSPDLESTAVNIWIRGSKAAHEDPEVTRDVAGTVRDTMIVVRNLVSRRPA